MMWAMAFTVPELPYPYDALEPHISAEIMRIHRDKHHQAYVDKANAALAGTEWEGLSPEEILTSLDDLPVVAFSVTGDVAQTTLANSVTHSSSACRP